MLQEDSNDKEKFNSRKYKLSLYSLGIIGAAFLASYKFNISKDLFDTFLMGILGVLTLYLGGNVSNKFVLAKGIKKEVKEESNGTN